MRVRQTASASCSAFQLLVLPQEGQANTRLAGSIAAADTNEDDGSAAPRQPTSR